MKASHPYALDFMAAAILSLLNITKDIKSQKESDDSSLFRDSGIKSDQLRKQSRALARDHPARRHGY